MKVILFDGVCNLCNSSVNWVIDHDKKNQFKFAALQSAYGQKKVADLGLSDNYMGTVVLEDDGKGFMRSDAVLEIARHIGGIYSAAVIFYIVPRFIRDFIYKIVADNRYRWFGKTESCRIPTPELKSKFLD
jgi:predicted DCC family thiol-disulfide oxidoreductase YuxK